MGGNPLGAAPLNEKGEPMRLLCALYCSEIRNIPDFPEKGVLQFFISDDEDLGLDRENPTAQKNFRVVFNDDEELKEVCDIKFGEPEFFPVAGCYSIRFMIALLPMTDSDFRFYDAITAEFKKNGAEFNEAAANEAERKFHSEGHRVGGYPYFVNEDPRASRPDLQKYDTMLLQIDDHDGFVNIGDTGVINFFISKEALKRRDFFDILYWWDDRSN